MGKKPSYEELEHKVKELEKAISERKRSEKESQAQAEWIRVLFSSIKGAIFVHPFKEEGFAPFTEVNDTACELYGYSREEFLHLSAPNITQKPDANAHSKYSHRSKLLEKGHLVFETVHIKKSGETFPVEINSNIVYQFGKPFILAVVRDITERKRAEKELRESEERYRLLADNVTDVIWVRDMNLKVTYMSPSVTEQLGYTVEEAKDRTLEETLTPDSYKHAVEVFTEELEAEKSKQKDMSRSRTIDAEINCKDGSTIWTEIKMSFLRNQNGDPIGIIGITRNITERKRAEEELQKLASVIKYSSELVNLATMDGKMIFLNEAGRKMLGIDSDEVKRIHIMEVIPNHMKELVQNELLPALMQGNTWEGELQYRNIKTGDLTDVYARTFTVSKPNTKEPLFLSQRLNGHYRS